MAHLASPFADEFRAFAEEEARSPLPADPVVFYGSSSIRLWSTLAADFPDLPVVNRGFGGSTLAECVHEMDRLLVKHRPRAIVLYAGENDLDHGAEPQHVLALFQRFAANVRGRLGPVPVIVLGVKPSPARMGNVARIRETNDLLRKAVLSWPGMHYIDVFAQMVNEHGQSDHVYFGEDWLHLSSAGYRLWTRLVRGAMQRIGLLS